MARLTTSAVENLAALSTAFSGIQLAIVVAGYLLLMGLREIVKELKSQITAQQKEVAQIDKRLAHVMGRLKIDDVEAD